MTAPFAIATADNAWFTAVRGYLLAAGIRSTDVVDKPLTSRSAVELWLETGAARLLVLDGGIPSDPLRLRDDSSTFAARDILEKLQGQSPAALVVVSSPAATAELEPLCIALEKALVLPDRRLRMNRENLLRPLLAMLVDPALGDPFRIVETEIQSDKVKVWLGVGGDAPMLEWNTVFDLSELNQAVRLYDSPEAPDGSIHRGEWAGVKPPKNWLDLLRWVGGKLFKVLVVDAIGEHLFKKIETAANGLEGLSFRFVITDASFYAAPFEASVRYRSEEFAPFVLLYAPLVRQVLLKATFRTPPAITLIPPGASVLFVRSQMGEFKGAPQDWMNFEGLGFDRLGNIDTELQHLRALETAGRIRLKLADLSEAPPGKAAQALRDMINETKPDVLHYSGHAWSDGRGTATLILPGAAANEAMGLRLDRVAAYEGLSNTKLVYLSACRGITKGTVQQVVSHGIPYALGFRWSVEDKRAPEFAKAFYEELCREHSVPRAFRKACRATWEQLTDDDESPIWVSPILLAQPADWAAKQRPEAPTMVLSA